MASVGWWAPSTPSPIVLVLAHITGAPGDGGTSQVEEMGPEGHGLLLCLQLPCWPLLHSQAAQRPPPPRLQGVGSISPTLQPRRGPCWAPLPS